MGERCIKVNKKLHMCQVLLRVNSKRLMLQTKLTEKNGRRMFEAVLSSSTCLVRPDGQQE
jgi:hypothetical protein